MSTQYTFDIASLSQYVGGVYVAYELSKWPS